MEVEHVEESHTPEQHLRAADIDCKIISGEAREKNAN